MLRLYDLGRKKLLRKCENKHIPHLVVDIKTVGERIICSDVQVNINSHEDEDTILEFLALGFIKIFVLISPEK